MWTFAYNINKSSSTWILYGKIINMSKCHEDRYEVLMENELFYGEGDQATEKEGWQEPDPELAYTIIDIHLFKTQQEAQRIGIKALMSGRIF